MGAVEKGGVEVVDIFCTFAAGNHAETAELAQVNRFAIGKGFVHHLQQAIEHEDDFTAARGTVVLDTGTDFVERQFLGDTGLCVVEGGAFGSPFAHVRSFDQRVH